MRENLCGDSQLSVYGVFDGHGEFGELVSGYCRDHLPTFLENEPNLKTDPVQALLSATAAMCAALARTAINRQFSGTTAVYGAWNFSCDFCSIFVCVHCMRPCDSRFQSSESFIHDSTQALRFPHSNPNLYSLVVTSHTHAQVCASTTRCTWPTLATHAA